MKLRKVFVLLLILICLIVNPILASADYIPTYLDTAFNGSIYINSAYSFFGSYTVPANARVIGIKGSMAGSYYFYDYLYYALNGSVQALIATKLYEQNQVSFYYPVSVSAGNTISFDGFSSASGDTVFLDIAVVLAFDYPSQTLVNQVKTSADNAASYASTASTNALSAKTSADNAAARSWYSGKSSAEWAYIAAQNSNTAPDITKVMGLNGATCTIGTTFTIIINASPSSGLQYRVSMTGFDSGWTSSNQVTITGLSSSGAKIATVEVRKGTDDSTKAQTTHLFFKI